MSDSPILQASFCWVPPPPPTLHANKAFLQGTLKNEAKIHSGRTLYSVDLLDGFYAFQIKTHISQRLMKLSKDTNSPIEDSLLP